MRKGQRGTSTERKFLCALPDSAHIDLAELLRYFDAARTKFSAGKILDKRWAINLHEPTTNWTADTLISWLQRVLAQYTSNPQRVSRGLCTPYEKVVRRCNYCSVQYRYPDAKYQVLRRLGARIGPSPRLHRPNSTPEPESLATIW
jgi:hypothetical protein